MIPSIPFHKLPIGCVFDTVDPTSDSWGEPFWIKTTASRFTSVPHSDKIGIECDPDRECWLTDLFQHMVMVTRLQAGIDK